ncbi:MAG: serine--tRNA ligase, partial [Symbiobacteriaceae bacterium]|nr:serine--tRNA ligase [Symbiobacteriaceae bacterium]
VKRYLSLDEKRRNLLVEVEQLKNRRNVASQEVARRKREGEDGSPLVLEMRQVGDDIAKIDEEVRQLENQLEELMLSLPNFPHPSTPLGQDESENVQVRLWGTPTTFGFPPLPHWDLGLNLNILDFERAAKIVGSRFTVYRGDAARLRRALISFMIDLHVAEHGYTEYFPPLITNRASMITTGQLPKFAEDLYHLPEDDWFLNPTAEVPLTNLFRGEILDAQQLPLRITGYCASFRSEAGSAGRDTRGVIRTHQFNKVELVQFVQPEVSYQALEELLGHAARVLELLELPYRVVEMCSGDLGFTASKKYDLEVWMPSYDRYVEISSCSNFEAFQARRGNIRFRSEGKVDYVHTLNGSGLAIDRCMAALLENHQTENGEVVIPPNLRPYMGKDKIVSQ